MSATIEAIPGEAVRAPERGGGLRGLLWLTWRQHRWPIATGVAVSAGMLVWMAVTAHRLAALIQSCGAGTMCGSSASSAANYQLNIVVFLPLLIGVFLGVPLLAREHEQRTLPLAWSQDVSPLRWLAGKTLILGALVAVLAASLAGEAEHVVRLRAEYTGDSLFEGTQYQAGGWLPLTLALAWFAFGVAAGAALRRTMPAIAVTVAGFLGQSIVLMPRLRPHFMTPLSLMRPIVGGRATAESIPTAVHVNEMSINSGGGLFVDAQGHTHSYDQVLGHWCAGYGPDQSTDALGNCLSRHGLTGTLQQYQPADRMGVFHLIENGANVGLLLVAAFVTWWCVRRAGR